MARLGKEKQSILDVIYNCLYRQSENYITKAEYKKNDNFAGDNKMKIKKAAGAVSGVLLAFLLPVPLHILLYLLSLRMI